MSSRIAIAGAGITGLTTAWALERRGHDVAIFEATDHPGGPIQTLERDGYRFETGPHTLLVKDKPVVDLLDDLDLWDEAVEASDAATTRYIVKNGEPVAVPMSPAQLATTPLLSPTARLRLLTEPAIPASDDDEIDEPLASFIERRFGAEVLDYLLDPFVGGVWAGDPRRLSARHAFPSLVEFEQAGGSVVAGAIRDKLLGDSDGDDVDRRLVSFDGGMQRLVDRLVDRLDADIHYDTPVRKLRRDDHDWRVIYQRGKARRGQSFDAVVSTMPPRNFGGLEWENIAPPADAVDELSGMTYAPCCVLGFGLRPDQVGHPLDGFGALVPRVENFNILGALFVSTMFPDRAPDDRINVTVFVGGARQPELTDKSDADLVEMARFDLRRLLDIRGEPEVTEMTRWPRAIPQYEVGHGVYLDRIDQIEQVVPHVYLAGNYRDGIAVPDLLEAGCDHARRIDDALD